MTPARCGARILAGRHEGASLDTLDLTTLLGLLPRSTPDSRALLEAYLDRREPGWRDHVQGGAERGRAPRTAAAR